uniref:CSON011040 protein n=1 Tax=Culicoides sonorensis TaxID=179676 RepID=A0A336M8D2_CULSO
MAATSAGQPICGDVTIKQPQPPIVVSQTMPGTIVSGLVTSSHQSSSQHMQRVSYVQRMPNSSTSSTTASSSLSSSSSHHTSALQQQQFIDNNNIINTGAVKCQNSNYLNEKNLENGNSNVIVNYNLAPGWRRLVLNGEIVYISPSDATLRDILQVKQYLLSTGTCKCGLPCPIRPESFFNFNLETPTVQLPANDSISTSCCSHRRYEETSHDLGNSRDSSVPIERKIKVTQNVVINPGMKRIVQRDLTNGNVAYEQGVNERVPPLPQQHTSSSSPSSSWKDDAKPNFINNKSKNLKKRPSFKDDPTGYLNHQTAILNNSISTLYSPGTGENLPANDTTKEQKAFVQQQQPYPNQRIRDVPDDRTKLITGSNDSNSSTEEPLSPMLAGQPVSHMTNGVVQVHPNCDMRQIKQQIQHQIEQRNRLIKQNQQLAMIRNNNNFNKNQNESNTVVDNNSKYVFVQSPIESPVSSSTALNRTTPEIRSASSTPDSKGPVQGPNVTTSNNENLSSASPSPEYISGNGNSYSVKRKVDQLQDQSIVKNTVTSVIAGRTTTTTTTSNTGIIQTNMNDHQQIFAPNGTIIYKRPAPKQLSQAMIQNCVANQSTNMQQLNLQTLQRDSNGQFIITPNSQVVMMQGASQKSNIITNNSNIGQFVGGNIVINNGEQQTMLQSPNSGVLIQNSNVVQPQQGFIQSPNSILTSNNQGFNLQPMILNNGTNILSSPNSNMITTVPTASPKMIQANSSTVQMIQNPSSNINQQIITQQNGQTVVLNTLPNGMIVQQPVDGQIVNRIIQDSSGNIIQQGSEMMLSPNSKRKVKKRKGSCGSNTPQGLSPQNTLQLSPSTIQSSPHTATQSQTNSMLQVNAISPQYQSQNFQLSPGISGLTIVPKNQNPQTSQPQQQILLQNGQTIIQPLGLLGQQLLVPAGLMVTPDNTLVQIQNLGQMGNIITPQGMVIRAQSPQQKQFLSPSTGQYIVSSNGQMSPMGQIYGNSVGLVQVPQSNSSSGQNQAGVLHQNTIVQHSHQNPTQQQMANSSTTIINSQGQVISGQHTTNIMTGPQAHNMKDFLNAGHSVSTQTAQQQLLQLQSSPPDTTTHSPQSPERPSSARSGASYEGMAMVQCVSSSEPDSRVSPTSIDQTSLQSTQIDYVEQKSRQVVQYLASPPNHLKTSDHKIKRIQMNARRNYYMSSNNYLSQNHHETKNLTNLQMSTDDMNHPDSHENSSSNSNSPTQSSKSPDPAFAINELVWGPARGYPAWPGKIVATPEGVTTPNDCVWIRWFGGRANIEMTSIHGLKTLSEGLEAHHSSLKDTRKSRKLNSQLERAIQEAMAELDQTPKKSNKQNNKKSSHLTSPSSGRGRHNVRTTLSSNNHQRKPVKIAPAPTTSDIK